MSPDGHRSSSEVESGFSPVDNELPLRWLRRLRLVPERGLGTRRRALFFVALTWLPIAVWAAMAGRLMDPSSGESLLRHYGINVRCLVAIPLLILGEAALHATVLRIASQFLSSGIVPAAQQPALEATLRRVRRIRDSSLPWVLVFGVTLAWLLIDKPDEHGDALSWALSPDGKLGFGGWWFAYVARPVFLAILLGWLWRVLLVAYWFWCVARLELSLVPTHPDRVGGLAFVQKLPNAFELVTLAMSAVVASGWAHEITVHGATLESYKLIAAAFVIVWTLFMLLPLLAFAPTLHAVRARALPAYAALVGEQGRLVHRRWILREPVEDTPILDAPEIGPVADAAAMYDAVKRMRAVPIGRTAILKILVPLAIPMLIVTALQVPIGELLLKVVNAVL
jgi:hypothetical protein